MNDLRRRFLAEAVSTAGPATVLVMLMDRLVLDLERADQALASGNRTAASEQIMHAQQIVDALHIHLDTGAWEGGPHLAALYDYVFSLLVTASVRADRAVLNEALSLIAPLRASWAEAATTPEATAALSTGPAPAESAPAASSGGLLGVG